MDQVERMDISIVLLIKQNRNRFSILQKMFFVQL